MEILLSPYVMTSRDGRRVNSARGFRRMKAGNRPRVGLETIMEETQEHVGAAAESFSRILERQHDYL
jgi:hypothetical protein